MTKAADSVIGGASERIGVTAPRLTPIVSKVTGFAKGILSTERVRAAVRSLLDWIRTLAERIVEFVRGYQHRNTPSATTSP